jgi:fibronectin type 3 domain-containing protein
VFLALRCVALLAGLCAVVSCTSTLDIERAREILRTSKGPEVPVIGDVVTEELEQIQNLRAISGELREVPLQWDPSLGPDVAGYVVERSLGEGQPFTRIAIVPGRFESTYVDRGADLGPKQQRDRLVSDLGDGETYVYRVRSYRADGRTGAKPSASSSAETAARPKPPEDLRAYSRMPRAIALSWSAVTDPAVRGYVVQRSPSAQGDFIEVGRVNHRYDTTFTDRDLESLRVFYYRVVAVNRVGAEGEPSTAIRGVTKPNPLPPIGLAVARQGLGSNRIRWDPNVEPDIRHYELFRWRRGATDPEPVARVRAGQGPEAEDAEVGAGELLRYSVVAVDVDGLRSVRSEPIEVRSRGYGLMAAPAANAIELRWEPAVHDEFKETLVLREGGIGARELGLAKAPKYRDRDVKPGSRYRYRVVGIRPDGTRAPPSAPVEVHIPEAAASAP